MSALLNWVKPDQTSQEGIKCNKAKEWLRSYCPNVYTVKQGVDFWGLTAQNEPWDGTVPDFTFNAMGWNATTQRDWIVEHLGPALEAAGYAGKAKISK